ncbi:MAG: hypothetical protein U9P68_13465 [Pseudomonadota bacterium]|nr:hypothetical protein [Pseudomonadota bacterium]
MARMRSPNFPALTLEEAMKVAGELYSKVRKVTLDREAAAKELGYSGLTGRSLKVLGALNQYGLIDNVAKGKCHVTDLAETALHGFPEEEKAGAIRRAARAPALFRAIYDEYGEGIQSEHAIRSLLLKRGFTDKGVESALQNFLATQRFAALNGASESYDSSESSAPELSPVAKSDEGDVEMPTSQTAKREAPLSPTPKALYRDQPLEFSLSSKGLAVTGGTSSAQELRAFIKKLEALVALLPDEEEADY